MDILNKMDRLLAEAEQHRRKLHPFCMACGWRKGGPDSWSGTACKCGHSEPPINRFDEPATVTAFTSKKREEP